ncbi:MAG: hypothetical protein GY822_32440 [Deltaproteobacteria bacterium]|nr:hypothetical protein [Deltaproteobacteria bacterium]
MVGDWAKNWAKDFQKDNPTAFYATATDLAGAIGAVGYTQGSDALKDLGIKPEFGTSFFDKQVRVEVEGEWDKGFDNFELRFNYQGDFKLSDNWNLKQQGHVEANFGDASYSGFLNSSLRQSGGPLRLGVGLSFDDDAQNVSFSLHDKVKLSGDTSLIYSGSANYNISEGNLDAARASVGLTGGAGRLSAYAAYDADRSNTTSVGLRASYQKDSFSASASTDFFLDSGDYQASISAGYNPTENLDIYMFGNHDSRTDVQSAGLGLLWRF